MGGRVVHCARHVLTNTRPQQLCWGDWEDEAIKKEVVSQMVNIVASQVVSLHAAVVLILIKNAATSNCNRQNACVLV